MGLAGLRILLVEDDSNECELLAGFLRLAGYNVNTAGDGAAALLHVERSDEIARLQPALQIVSKN